MVFIQQIILSYIAVSKLRTFIDHAIVLSMCTLSFFVVIVCCLFDWKEICSGFCYSLVYSYIAVGDPIV
jgi:hypothetical protein